MAIRQCHNCKHNGKGDSECITCAMRKAHDSPMQGRVKPVPLPVLEKLAPEDARENPAKYSDADARILDFFNTVLDLPAKDRDFFIAMIVHAGNIREAARRSGLTIWAARRARHRIRAVPCLRAVLQAVDGEGAGFSKMRRGPRGGA